MRGALMSAESLRRSQAGSLQMAAFIDTASGRWQNIPARLETLAEWNDILRELIPPMIFVAPWMIPAFYDLATGID